MARASVFYCVLLEERVLLQTMYTVCQCGRDPSNKDNDHYSEDCPECQLAMLDEEEKNEKYDREVDEAISSHFSGLSERHLRERYQL
jgi:hypothetical protein